jgi:large subunit ribosomal protein L25
LWNSWRLEKMEKILLKAEARTELGKGGARSLRRSNMLPAIIYAGGKSTPIKLDRKEIVRLISSGVGEHALINIELAGEKSKEEVHPSLIKGYQADPVTNELLHVDFLEVSLKKKIKINIPIVLTKEPAGVKLGGILQHHLREVQIECLPTQIPDGIEVDAEFIGLGHSLHVSDLQPPEGIKILTDSHEVIILVTAPVVEEVPEVEEEAEEPELVKAKGKEEGEAEAEGEQQKQEEKEK